MKFRFGLIIGLAVGYVSGARAGRERYEQIVSAFNAARSNEQIRDATDIAERSTRGTRAAAGRGIVSIADTIRERAAR
ncbi:MAG: hypothetical protein V3S38_06810 [Acidimicrobiia bacterium]